MSIDTRQIKEFALPEGSSIPQGITCGPDGKMWFTLPNSHRIGSIDAVGKITEFELPDNGGDPGGPSEIALGPDKSLWFTEFNNDRIGKIDTAGTITELSDGITQGSSPNGIAVGPDGNIWFTEYNGNRIGRLKSPAQP